MTAGVTYDAGALIAAAKNHRGMWRLHAAFLALELIPTVPAPVLAQVWRGGSRQASLTRLLRGCAVEVMDEEAAQRIGVLAGKAGHDDIVDVAVAQGALARNDIVVTSDPDHLETIAAAVHRKLPIKVI